MSLFSFLNLFSSWPKRLLLFWSALLLALHITGCAPSKEPTLILPPPLTTDSTEKAATLKTPADKERADDQQVMVAPEKQFDQVSDGLSQKQPLFTEVPVVQAQKPPVKATTKEKLPLPAKSSATLNFYDMPVPAFINELYGNILQVPFQIDPEVAKLSDLVTLRTTEPQHASTLYDLGLEVLAKYGIGADTTGNLLYFAPSKKVGNEAPLIVSGRTLPEVPITHRPIFMFVPLHMVKPKEADQWLNQAFQGQNLKITGDNDRNALIIMGPPELVNQAVEAVTMLDQPFMRGRFSLRINPEYNGAIELSAQLAQVLQAEGYSVSVKPTESSGIIILPIESARTILAFATSQEQLDHIKQWVLTLDIPSQQAANTQSIFFYDVQNTSVTSLATTLDAILEGGQSTANKHTALPITPSTQTEDVNSTTAPQPVLPETGAVVADELRNSLVFKGSREQWNELLKVIHRFDRPSKQVLIEVTVAEITLTDALEKGVEWQAYINQNKQIPSPLVSENRESAGISTSSADTPAQGPLSPKTPKELNTLTQQTVRTLLNPYTLFDFGTVDRLGLPSNGFTFTLESAGHTKAILNAFARDNRVNIISTPRVLVRSGTEAKIEVGTDVPTVTASQTSSGYFNANSNAGLIQSIEYRKTGVLLDVKPIVYSGNRIDLKVSQEISDISSQSVTNISSPAILSRKIETDVTLADGGSVLLGGLISTTTTEEERGIPWLKDIPLLGQLFRVDSKSNTKSMVVMLIVPYIIENQDDAAAITEAIKRRLNIRAEDPLDTQEIQPRNPRKRFKRGSESRGIRGN